MLRYDPEKFAGVPRAKFLRALRAEGVPCSPGYTPLNRQAFLKEALGSRAYRRIYEDKRLKDYWEANRCPENDRLCEEAVWMGQTMLLAGRADMDQVAAAVRKIQANAGKLAKA
jgi:hypothetical protein